VQGTALANHQCYSCYSVLIATVAAPGKVKNSENISWRRVTTETINDCAAVPKGRRFESSAANRLTASFTRMLGQASGNAYPGGLRLES
jgi:phosphoribosyl-dephospho-CoA transferase